jgi:5'-nucleotidase
VETLLLVNDDGVESPTVVPFVSALYSASFCKELRVVLPAEEQSWIAQAVTRFRTITVAHQQVGPISGFLVNGTPADCTSLGINNLYSNSPDAVISGINMGINAGLAFFLSSGTVGGAAESFLFGLKAVAISIDTPHEVFKNWSLRQFDALESVRPSFERLSYVATSIVGKLLSSQIWNTTHLVSVNIPWEADLTTRCEITTLSDTRFEPFFIQTGPNRYRHEFKALIIPNQSSQEPRLLTDIEALQAGYVSMNPISYRLNDHLAANELQEVFSEI